MAERILVDLPYMKSACFFPSFESLLEYSIASFHYTISVSDEQYPDLSRFRSLFSRVLKRAYPVDPPLEAVWFFSAIIYHNAPDELGSILGHISVYTANSPAAAKPIALLAPLVSVLFRSKPGKRTTARVESLLGYITDICSSRSRPAAGDAGRLLPMFDELVKVWDMRDSSGRCPFDVLFPLVRDEDMRELKKEGCSVAFLAGVVVAETFLLSLCLKVKGATMAAPSDELKERLMTSTIASLQVFKNKQFFGVLLNMLANPPLPVGSLLSDDDEILVREVLCDALVLLDYSFLSGAEVDQADSFLSPIFVSRLVISFDAIRDARHKGYEGRAMSYIQAFSTSDIPSYLTSWAHSHQCCKPFATTPQEYLKWLVDLEDKGLQVFGGNCPRIRKMLMHDEGQDDNQSRISRSDADLFFTDKHSHQEGMNSKGREDEESMEMETADNALIAAAHSMKMMANGTRKRKDCETEDNR